MPDGIVRHDATANLLNRLRPAAGMSLGIRERQLVCNLTMRGTGALALCDGIDEDRVIDFLHVEDGNRCVEDSATSS